MNESKIFEQKDFLKKRVFASEVAQWLGLKKSGDRFYCPNCQSEGGSRPNLSTAGNRFHCWKCSERGDVYDLIRLSKGLKEFKPAIEWLHKQVSERQIENSVRVTEQVSIKVPARDNVSEVYSCFLQGMREPAGDARQYLSGRAISDSVIERLQIKSLGRDHDSVMKWLTNKFEMKDLEDAGLYKQTQYGPWARTALYASRGIEMLVFPYIENGEPVYLKVRPLAEKEDLNTLTLPRFLNVGGTVPCLYNIDNVKTSNSLVVCEGETDTLSALSLGLAAVGIPGWAHFKASWVKGLKGKTVTLIMDGDEAGRAANYDIGRKFSNQGQPPPNEIHLPQGKDLNDILRGELRRLFELCAASATAKNADEKQTIKRAQKDYSNEP